MCVCLPVLFSEVCVCVCVYLCFSQKCVCVCVCVYLCFSQKNLLICDYCLLSNVMGAVSFDYLEGKEGGKR